MNIADLTVLPKQALDALAGLFAQSSYTVSGLTLSATGAGSLSITVAAGTCWVNGTYVSYAGGTVVPGAAGTNPRYDLIRFANGAAVPSIVAGTASSTPAFPALGAGDLFIGYAFIGAGATDYTVAATAFISDYTMPFTLGNGAAATPSLVFKNSLTTGMYRAAADTIGWVTAGVERMRLSSAGLLLGVASSVLGKLLFANSTNANTLTIQASVFGASITWTLPTAQGAALTFLQNDGSGVLSWATPAGSTINWKEYLYQAVATTETTTSTTAADLSTVETLTTGSATLNDKLSVHGSATTYTNTNGDGAFMYSKLDAAAAVVLVLAGGGGGTVASDPKPGSFFQNETGLTAATHTEKKQYSAIAAGTATVRNRTFEVIRFA